MQKIYYKEAQLLLNSSIVVLIPTIIFILLNILVFSDIKLMVFTAPFLAYSFYLFHLYLINYKRYVKLSKKNEVVLSKPDFSSSNHFVLHKVKDVKELLFFHPSGKLAGKILQNKNFYPKKFILMDDQDRPLAYYLYHNHIIDVYHQEKGYLGGFRENENFQLLSGEWIGKGRSNSNYLDDRIINEQNCEVFRVQKGWLELGLAEKFIHPNSPILTLHPSLEDNKRMIYYALLIKRFFITTF